MNYSRVSHIGNGDQLLLLVRRWEEVESPTFAGGGGTCKETIFYPCFSKSSSVADVTQREVVVR